MNMKKFLLSLSVFTLVVWASCLAAEYNKELQDAYNWAYEHSITTQPTINSANMMWKITRAELAKMMVWYSVNVMWKETPTQFKCNFSDIWNIDPTLEIAVLQACDLWIMWQWITEFRPNDTVTRAEFWTVLSRALWWNKYEWWITYYQKHLKALNGYWIMNNISSPMDKEIRWYVMLMLMRSSNTDINDVKQDTQISEVIKMLDN